MIKKTISYSDFNGNELTEDFYFNLSPAEVIEMELGTVGGFNEFVQKIVQAADVPALSKLFTDFILKAYGEKSPDGKRFIKSEEMSIAFKQTDAYSQLLMELIADTDAAIEFVNGVFPKESDITKRTPKLVNFNAQN